MSLSIPFINVEISLNIWSMLSEVAGFFGMSFYGFMLAAFIIATAGIFVFAVGNNIVVEAQTLRLSELVAEINIMEGVK